jgi:hypothetical protein
MYITIELLQKRGACQEYLDFFAKQFPDGVEMMYMLERGHLPYYAYHWGYQHLDPDENEVAAYWKRVHVTNSEGVYESDHIDNSSFISESSQIINSENIYRSKEINNCTYISDSECVDNSKQVGISSFIDNCERIIKGKNITNSEEVYDSIYVVDSMGIYRSENVVDSNGIWDSNSITHCGFCANCKNLTNSLFCHGLVDGEYYLFNKQIDKFRFDMIAKQYKKYAPEFQLTEDWADNFGNIPAARYDYRKHFEKVTDSFWAWVQTLPGYDPSIIYSITFDPRFLI